MGSPSSRNRSASPAREPPSKKLKASTKSSSSGFRWKEKRQRDDSDAANERAGSGSNGGRLERGYRDRYHADDHRRTPRDDRLEDDKHGSRARPTHDEGREGGDSWRPRDRDRDRDRGREREEEQQQRSQRREQQRGGRDEGGGSGDGEVRRRKEGEDRKPGKKAAAKPFAPPTTATAGPPGEPMIVVNINDRLGTKAAIPCLASDSIRAFKAVVAAHIGRQPHEIMLKRQGERPFKDQLTLRDYGVSNGVQLDLELDTGD